MIKSEKKADIKYIRGRKSAQKIRVREIQGAYNRLPQLKRNSYVDLSNEKVFSIEADTIIDEHLFLAGKEFVETLKYERQLNVKK